MEVITKKMKYEGLEITFRLWENGMIEMKLDEALAKANGCSSIETYLESCNFPRELAIPQWIEVRNGQFIAYAMRKEYLN